VHILPSASWNLFQLVCGCCLLFSTNSFHFLSFSSPFEEKGGKAEAFFLKWKKKPQNLCGSRNIVMVSFGALFILLTLQRTNAYSISLQSTAATHDSSFCKDTKIKIFIIIFGVARKNKIAFFLF
jgi:hypothetical protein